MHYVSRETIILILTDTKNVSRETICQELIGYPNVSRETIVIRACVHREDVRIFEHNLAECKGAGVRWTPLRSRSTDRDDS